MAKRIYVSLTSALYDLHRGTVNHTDIIAVVSNTNFPDYEFAINYIKEGHQEPSEAKEANIKNLSLIWGRLLQPIEMFEGHKFPFITSHFSGDRYFEVPTGLKFPQTVDYIKFVYEKIWANGGWVWNSAVHRQDEKYRERIRAFLAAYPSV